MSRSLLKRLSRQLAEFGGKALRRELKTPTGIDFSSNDYLGLARHPELLRALQEAVARTKTIGSGGSRLLRGNHVEHEELEAFAARFFGADSALYFASGFDANLSIFSALPSKSDAVVYDERIHASVREGLRSSLARSFPVRHNDAGDFETVIRTARKGGARAVFVAVESVYSMDGDRAPLEDLVEIVHRRDATLVVDEAHATGIYGSRGRGLTEGLNCPGLIAVHTCGKALGASGALVCMPAVAKDYLIHTARPFVFSTAPSPLLAAVVQRALGLVRREPWRREKLLALSQFARNVLSGENPPWNLLGDGTHILPIEFGDAQRTTQIAARLQARGLDVRAIRPPTVPKGGSRLRVSLNALRTEAEVLVLAQALREAADRGITRGSAASTRRQKAADAG